jgi:hypothetical protein
LPSFSSISIISLFSSSSFHFYRVFGSSNHPPSPSPPVPLSVVIPLSLCLPARPYNSFPCYPCTRLPRCLCSVPFIWSRPLPRHGSLRTASRFARCPGSLRSAPVMIPALLKSLFPTVVPVLLCVAAFLLCLASRPALSFSPFLPCLFLVVPVLLILPRFLQVCFCPVFLVLVVIIHPVIATVGTSPGSPNKRRRPSGETRCQPTSAGTAFYPLPPQSVSETVKHHRNASIC